MLFFSSDVGKTAKNRGKDTGTRVNEVGAESFSMEAEHACEVGEKDKRGEKRK